MPRRQERSSSATTRLLAPRYSTIGSSRSVRARGRPVISFDQPAVYQAFIRYIAILLGAVGPLGATGDIYQFIYLFSIALLRRYMRRPFCTENASASKV